MVLLRALKYLVLVVVALVVLFLVGSFLGVVGVPQITDVSNEFGDVNDSTTEIHTTVTVDNPNPIGFSSGDVTIDYTVYMNDVEMAAGQKDGVVIGSGRSQIETVSYLDNSKIPDWWYRHIRDSEVSEMRIDAEIRHDTFGSHTVTNRRTIETNILESFNDNETRPVNASSEFISDPAVYINETSTDYGAEVTREQTPMNMSFTVYNPKPYPYAITAVGYTVNMNDVEVGQGEADRGAVIEPEATETIEAQTVIDNENLDEWWVTHIENDQVSDLHVDIYLVIRPEVAGRELGTIRIDADAFDHRETIETDIFGTKDNETTENGTMETESTGDDTDRTVTAEGTTPGA